MKDSNEKLENDLSSFNSRLSSNCPTKNKEKLSYSSSLSRKKMFLKQN